MQQHQWSNLTPHQALTLAPMIAKQQTSMPLICIPLVTLIHLSQATMDMGMLISITVFNSPQLKRRFTTHQKHQHMNCKQEQITLTSLSMTSQAEMITMTLILCSITSITIHTKDSTDLLIITIEKRETTFL